MFLSLLIAQWRGGGAGWRKEGGVECQLKASKSGVCLDQHWMFRDRGEEGGEGPKFRCHKFFFCLFLFFFVSSLSAPL